MSQIPKMRFFKTYCILVFTLLFVASCGVKKSTAIRDVKMLSSARKVIKKYERNKTDIKTFSSKIDAFFDNGKQSISGTISLRMEKGKVIWLSISKYGFTVAKAKITPNRVQYYEKWKKVSFDGDFSLISKKIGVELSFEQLENLLLGQSIRDLSKRKYSFDVEQKSYQFQLKNPRDILEYIVWMRPDNFKMKRQYIVDKKGKSLTVNYKEYQNVDSLSIPEDISLEAVSSSRRTRVNLTYKRIEINEALRFPFRIPKGYKKISL